MLDATILMNSTVEDVIGWKCCNLPDQNLEIHLKNKGTAPLVIPARFTLAKGRDRYLVTNVYPPGKVTVAPGDIAALYCNMDDSLWERYDTLILEDAEGNAYRFSTTGSAAAEYEGAQ